MRRLPWQVSPPSSPPSSASQASCRASWRLSELDALVDQLHDANALLGRVEHTERGRATHGEADDCLDLCMSLGAAVTQLRERVAGPRPLAVQLALGRVAVPRQGSS
jgi:hypothetical protein